MEAGGVEGRGREGEGAFREGVGAYVMRDEERICAAARKVLQGRRGQATGSQTAQRLRNLIQAPVAALEYRDQTREELRGETAVGNPMINGQSEIRQRAYDDGSLSRHDTIAPAADGEYRGLRWIDDRCKAVRPLRAKI